MELDSCASLETIRKRALILEKIRFFFQQRHVLEVETPSLSFSPSLDLHIDPFNLSIGDKKDPAYLVTSPEFHMKRLLSQGIGSIYQICKAFRSNEIGIQHNPEFSIVEWYRVGWDHWQLIEEVEIFFDEVLNCGKADRVSYQEIFKRFFDFNPLQINHETFLQICAANNLVPPDALQDTQTDRDSWLHYLMGVYIEPKLKEEGPVVIHGFPLSQSILSEKKTNNSALSTRFEYYFQGMELANGCSELRSGKEQKIRFEQVNLLRKKENKNQLKIDQRLIKALDTGIPKCAGVAVGLDRLIMIALGKSKISEVLSFSWDVC